MRQFIRLEGAQEMFLVLFPEEFLFHDAGHSAHSSVLAVQMKCPLHLIKELSTPDYNFATQSVLENCIQTVYVLVIETESIQFL